MSDKSKRPRIVLRLTLVFLLGFVLYEVGLYLWTRHHHRAAQLALEARDVPRAAAHVRKCSWASPDDIHVLLLAAQLARRQGHFDEASQHLRRFREKNGPEEIYNLERRLLQAEKGDLPEAFLLVLFCTEHPDTPEMRHILEAGIAGILKALETAFAMGSTTQRAQVELQVNQTKKAIALWLEKCPSQADQIQGLVWRARWHAFVNDQPNALADIRQALERDPDHFEARLYLAVFLTQAQPAEAVSQLRILRDKDPANNRVRFALASILRSLGELDEARDILDELLISNPENLTYLVERGKLALDAEQLDVAERWLRKALALAPDQPAVLITLSRCLQLAGRSDEAKIYQERLRQLEAERKEKSPGRPN